MNRAAAARRNDEQWRPTAARGATVLLWSGRGRQRQRRRRDSLGDIAEVESNRPNSLEAFDFIQTEAAIVWSGSGVWLGVDAEHPALLKLAIRCSLEAESCEAIQYRGGQRMKLHRNARLSVKGPRAAGRSCRERRR